MSPTIVNKMLPSSLPLSMRSHMKHSFHMLHHGLETFERDKRLGLASTFISFSSFHMMKHWNSCFIYYVMCLPASDLLSLGFTYPSTNNFMVKYELNLDWDL